MDLWRNDADRTAGWGMTTKRNGIPKRKSVEGGFVGEMGFEKGGIVLRSDTEQKSEQKVHRI
jgi:hypothetical protein